MRNSSLPCTDSLLAPARMAATLLVLVALLMAPAIHATQPPSIINYQGRVAVDGVNFDGSADFRFALVNGDGTTTYWSNDGTSAAGSEPTAAVSLAVTKGLYACGLGDTALANMTAVPSSVFTDNATVKLRVWFDDGTNGSVLLTPDQRITSVGYALSAASAESAESVSAGAITEDMLADNAVTTEKLENGAVTTNKLSPAHVLGGGSSAGVGGVRLRTAGGGRNRSRASDRRPGK